MNPQEIIDLNFSQEFDDFSDLESDQFNDFNSKSNSNSFITNLTHFNKTKNINGFANKPNKTKSSHKINPLNLVHSGIENNTSEKLPKNNIDCNHNLKEQSQDLDLDFPDDDFEIEFDSQTLKKVMETEELYYASQAEQFTSAASHSPIPTSTKNNSSIANLINNKAYSNEMLPISLYNAEKSSTSLDSKTNNNTSIIQRAQSANLESISCQFDAQNINLTNNLHNNHHSNSFITLPPIPPNQVINNQKSLKVQPNYGDRILNVNINEKDSSNNGFHNILNNDNSVGISKLSDKIADREKRIMELEEKLSLQRGEIETVRRKLQKAENDNVNLQETLVSVTEKLSVEKSFIQEKMQKQMDSFKTQLEFQIQESSALLRKKSTISISNEYDKPSHSVNIVSPETQPKATSSLPKKRKT
ncbi:hypothetical protein AYI70_g1539, partial [Smittium culicis]